MLSNFKLKEYIKILDYLKPRKTAFFTALFFDCIAEGVFYLILPVMMKIMIDASITQDTSQMKQGIILYSIVCVSGISVFVISLFYFLFLREKTSASVRHLLFRKMLRLPVSYIERTHSGDIISRLTNDMNSMQGAYGWPLRNLILKTLIGIISIIIIFIINWKIGIFLIPIGLFSVLINSKQLKIIGMINNDIQKLMARFTEKISNILNGFYIMKSYLLGNSLVSETVKVNREIFENSAMLAKKNALIESRNFFFNALNFGGIAALASILFINGISSLGSVISMIFLIINVNFMFKDTNVLLMQLQGFVAGANRISEIMNIENEPERIDIDSGQEKNAKIELKDITFSYNNTDMVLNGVNIVVKEGQVAALVGPSGGGKSTIIKLILGYYAPLSGKMTINGCALKDYSLKELRDLIAYVPQDAYIFDGTVEENIRYGKLDAAKHEIEEAAGTAHADEFINGLEAGYNTRVGERGIKLSVGQRQRIALARAFLKDSPIILLDEATSSLDSQSEKYVQDALKTLMEKKTVLVIAHRLSTIEHADVIYVVDSGRIVEHGKHNELLERDSLYQKLYSQQFE